MALPRFLNLDALAGRFNRWFAPAALAAKAGPGDARDEHDPIAIVAALGETERQADQAHGREEDLPPLIFDSEKVKEFATRRRAQREGEPVDGS